jgi:pimeloyl-ACP methyl ester carboxylesterase
MSSSLDLRNGSAPTVLLVHGAFADASSWAGVIAQLQSAGIDIFALPTRCVG